MKGKIRPDDLRAGKFVIVSRWYDENLADEDDSWPFYRPPAPKKPVGIPFRVLAIALPFITLEPLVFDASKKRGVLDTRLAELIEVDVAYVRSLVPDFKPVAGSRGPRQILSADDRLRIQRYTAKEGWTEILREPE